MFIFSLLISCSVSILYDGHPYYHRTAHFGMQRGTYNITSGLHFLRATQSACSSWDLVFDITSLQNKVVMAKSEMDTQLCSDLDVVSVLQRVQLGSNQLQGVVLFLSSGYDDRHLPFGPDNIEGFPFPVVYVTHRTYMDIASSWMNDLNPITLSLEYDIDSDIPSHAPSTYPSEAQIEAPRKNIWWWLSATTLQDWLFLLFGFLCVILLLLIFLKFYKLCRRRINNSVVIRNLRVRRIERIATIKYDASKVMNDSCVVCLDDFEENTPVKVLGCRHGYHPRCIDIWLMQSDKCPLCNTDAIKSKKRIYDPCFCFCYRNADNFGFQDRENPEPRPQRNVELPEVQNGGNRFQDALIQH